MIILFFFDQSVKDSKNLAPNQTAWKPEVIPSVTSSTKSWTPSIVVLNYSLKYSFLHPSPTARQIPHRSVTGGWRSDSKQAAFSINSLKMLLANYLNNILLLNHNALQSTESCQQINQIHFKLPIFKLSSSIAWVFFVSWCNLPHT